MNLDYTDNTAGLPFTQEVYTDFSKELQWSPNFLISIILSGRINIHYKNHTREFKTHDIFFFMPFQTYSYLSSDSDTQVLTLSVNCDYIKRLCSDMDNLTFQKSHITKDLSNSTYIKICTRFSTIIFNNKKDDTCSRLKLMEAITGMIITIFESFGIKAEKNEHIEYSKDRIMKIMQYINEHYNEKISVNDISKYLGIHPQYFSSFFNKHFKSNFNEYLNTFRINHSLEQLIYSKDSILTIALDYGFSNHKTYAAAFRKLYGLSPTEYRKNHAEHKESADLLKDKGSSDSNYGIFAYFRQFLDTDNYSESKNAFMQSHETISLNPHVLSKNAFENTQYKFLSIGRAYAALRSELQQQVIQAKKDFDFDFIRIRDIFSDDLYVYFEDGDKKPIFSWQTLDSVFDFITGLGAKPFPEIGYMPDKMAAKKQYAGWQYHPNISMPKSYDLWKNFIQNFLMHLIDRYGLKEVSGWPFDFWTCPDLKVNNAYWNESMEEFFKFYKVTYEVFKSVDESLMLGSPNFSTIYGRDWYIAFFDFCKENNIKPAYVSAHLYGCDMKSEKLSPLGFNEIDASNFSVVNQNIVPNNLKSIKKIADECGFSDLNIIVSDWNLTFIPKDYIRDSCYMGPYIAHTYFNSLKNCKGLCYWTLSDIHEDFFPENSMFRGGPGLLDYHGFKKAAYNAFVLLNKLGKTVLEVGENYLFSKDADSYALLIYNMPDFDYMYEHIDNSAIDETHRYNIYANSDDLLLNIMINLPKGSYYIKKSEVNRAFGSAYDMWGEMGFPSTLSKDMEEHLRKDSVPKVSYSLQNVSEALILDELVPAHGIMLLEITPK